MKTLLPIITCSMKYAIYTVTNGDEFTVTFTTDWPAGITPADLVGEDYFFQPVNLNVKVIEEDQVDSLIGERTFYEVFRPVNA